jgi:murein DD-endopeptidase MepM/ murein hydrolase activator NlpD
MRKWIFRAASLLVIILVPIWLWMIGVSRADKSTVIGAEPGELEQRIEYIYGIPSDSFDVVEATVKRNQMLGNILYEYGISDKQVLEISKLPKDLFDVKKFKAGNRYALFLDSIGVRYFVYEKDKVNYAVVHIEDSIHVEIGEKPVVAKTVEFSGELKTSLWQDFKDEGVNPMLAIELSEIYAWSIDFFGLQEGDKFKVIYDESFVDSNSVGITRVHAAWFNHANHEFWAIPFEQDSVMSFFDEEGNSLRKAFLKAPLRFSRISSGFSNSRMHPVLKIRRPHHGVDYAAPTGTPVQAIGDGQVFKVAYQRNGGGNYVKIKHNSVYSTTYMHLSKFGKGIKQGVYVKQGDVIGYVGSTGLSTGAHLDFRFFKNGKAIDPLKVEAPPVEPVHEENLLDYNLVKLSMMAAIEQISSDD